MSEPEFEPTERVVTLRVDGTPAGSIGTVETGREDYALVRFDGDETPFNDDPVRRVPNDQLRAVGCETCDHTGIVAERREGRLYRTACPDCFPEGKRLGHWPDAEEYHVRHVV